MPKLSTEPKTQDVNEARDKLLAALVMFEDRLDQRTGQALVNALDLTFDGEPGLRKSHVMAPLWVWLAWENDAKPGSDDARAHQMIAICLMLKDSGFTPKLWMIEDRPGLVRHAGRLALTCGLGELVDR